MVFLFQVDFFEYLQVVHDALERDGPQCNIELKEAIKSVEDIIDNPIKWQQLNGKLNYKKNKIFNVYLFYDLAYNITINYIEPLCTF